MPMLTQRPHDLQGEVDDGGAEHFVRRHGDGRSVANSPNFLLDVIARCSLALRGDEELEIQHETLPRRQEHDNHNGDQGDKLQDPGHRPVTTQITQCR